MDRFDECHRITAAWEGGWSNHKADPGGKTMYGVTEAVYHDWLRRQGRPASPVRDIKMAEALKIYRDLYWAPTAVKYNLFPGVDLAVYDAAVNSGVSRGVKWLKESVGSNNHAETVKRICRRRLSFMQSLAIWKTFGKGWGNRVADVEAKGVKMALAAMAIKPETVELILKSEAEQAGTEERKAKTNAGASGAGGVAAGGGAASPDIVSDAYPAYPELVEPLAGWVLGGLFVIAVIAVVYFVAQTRAAKARKEAYTQEALS